MNSSEIRGTILKDYTDMVDAKLLKVLEPLNYTLTGLVEEVGEVSRLIRKTHQGKAIDIGDFRDELGDVLFYLAAMARVLDLPLESIMLSNIQKLNLKHGEST